MVLYDEKLPLEPLASGAPDGPPTSLSLLRGPFRGAYLALAVSQLGSSLQFVAVLWYAVSIGGPFGVIAVRVASTVPSLLFGAHGGVSADRWDRRSTVIGANVLAGAAFAPLAIVGITGRLPLWGLATSGLVAATATAYFVPAFGSLVPTLVGTGNVQQANALVSATNAALTVAGWGLAAGLLASAPIGVFFAVNSATFFMAAALLALLPKSSRATAPAAELRFREGLHALRMRPGLRSAVTMLTLGMTVMTGVWTVGIADLAHSRFSGASSLSFLLLVTGIGTIGAGAYLSRRRVRHKVSMSTLVWALLLPGYLLLGFARSLPVALAGTLLVGVATAAAAVLLTAAVQESVPEELLGRVMAVVFLANVGAKPVGLLLIGPLFAIIKPQTMFVTGGVAVSAIAAIATASVSRASRAADSGRAVRAGA